MKLTPKATPDTTNKLSRLSTAPPTKPKTAVKTQSTDSQCGSLAAFHELTAKRTSPRASIAEPAAYMSTPPISPSGPVMIAVPITARRKPRKPATPDCSPSRRLSLVLLLAHHQYRAV